MQENDLEWPFKTDCVARFGESPQRMVALMQTGLSESAERDKIGDPRPASNQSWQYTLETRI
ncbi:MAG: hypothetical protein A3J40_00970 [Erythrobacter sp. RIFCSPHIGHO2_12_FULL_63_10]|nr:MAG: hypothetical protein A3J40_00970 [Erythrobacter sp. RIFCSPHIGHO2_12_FULL_63_10]